MSKERASNPIAFNKDLDQQIGFMNELKIRDIVADILAKSIRQDDEVVPSELEGIKKLWQYLEDVIPSKEVQLENLKTTLQFATKYFLGLNLDYKTLGQQGAFYKNIAEKINGDTDVRDIMEMFCHYLIKLSEKNKAQQQHSLREFLPKDESEIACMGGSGVRLQKALLDLSIGNDHDRVYFDSHDITIRQIIDSLKDFVPEGNEIHLVPYLNYSLGIETRDTIIRVKKDPTFLTPQAYIPAHMLFKIQQEYVSKYKENLIKQVKGLKEEKLREIQEIKDQYDIVTIYTKAYDGDTKAIEEMKLIKEKFQALIGKEDVVLVTTNGEDYNYLWNDVLIQKSLENKIILSLGIAGLEEHRDESMDGYGKIIDELLQKDSFFRDSTPGLVSRLLNSDTQRITIASINILWALGEETSCNSPIQFIKILEEFGKIRLIPIEESKEDLSKSAHGIKRLQEIILPNLPEHQKFKIQRIIDRYEFYVKHEQSLIKPYLEDKNNNQLFRLLYGNIGCKEMSEVIISKDSATLQNELNAISNLDNDLKIGIYKNLLLRPDLAQILQSLKDKEVEFSDDLLKELLELAIEYKNPDAAQIIFDKFQQNYLNILNELNGVNFLFNAINSGSEKIVESLLGIFKDQKSKSEYLRRTSDYGDNALHLAAKLGNNDIVKTLLAGNGRDLAKEYLNILDNVNRHQIYINLQGSNIGKDAIYIAAENGHLEVVKTLLSAVSDDLTIQKKYLFNNVLMQPACDGGHINVVRFLLDKFQNNPKERRKYLKLQDRHGSTALHYAAENGHNEVVKILLDGFTKDDLGKEQKSKIQFIEISNQEGFIPTYLATQNGHNEVLQTILGSFNYDHDSKVKHIYDRGIPTTIVRNGHIEVFKTILDIFGPDNDARMKSLNRLGRAEQLINLAREKGYEEIVKTVESVINGTYKTQAQLEIDNRQESDEEKDGSEQGVLSNDHFRLRMEVMLQRVEALDQTKRLNFSCKVNDDLSGISITVANFTDDSKGPHKVFARKVSGALNCKAQNLRITPILQDDIAVGYSTNEQKVEIYFPNHQLQTKDQQKLYFKTLETALIAAMTPKTKVSGVKSCWSVSSVADEHTI